MLFESNQLGTQRQLSKQKAKSQLITGLVGTTGSAIGVYSAMGGFSKSTSSGLDGMKGGGAGASAGSDLGKGMGASPSGSFGF